MTALDALPPPTAPLGAEKAITLALRLAHAENALRTLSSGQVDAIVDPEGKTYLLRPAQEHLRERERRLRHRLASNPDVLTEVNRAGVILSQDGAVTRVLGYQAGELVGRNFFLLVHTADLAEVHAVFVKIGEGLLESATVEFRHRLDDGFFRLIEATVARLGEAGEGHLIFSLRPVRPRMVSAERETALALATLARDRFVAILSHELRTPLTPVLLGVRELRQDSRFAEAEPILAMIQRNLRVQSQLLEELGEFTGIAHQKGRLRLGEVDAHEAIRQVLEICASELAAARIEVTLDLRATEPRILADSTRLQQVLWNLVKNAVKFSPPGSGLSIASDNQPAGWLTLAVSDRGVGIEPGLLPLVFAPFQQGDRSMGRDRGGLGLGLFIAKELTEAQQGTITVSSGGRGQGATFRLGFKNAPPPNGQPPRGDDPACPAVEQPAL